MNSPVSLKHLETMQTSAELFRRLLQTGYGLEAPACVITWGHIAAALAEILVDHGLPPDRLDDAFLQDMVQDIRAAAPGEPEPWQEWLRSRIIQLPGLAGLLEPPDLEGDEGYFTEHTPKGRENATRLGDEEGYWIDGGDSADFFDDY